MSLDFLSEKEQIALYLEDMYSKFGFTKYQVNRFEEYSFYMEKENFLSDSRILTFSGSKGKLMALKPDVTMSIVKNCLKESEKNHKIYYKESVFRIPKGDDDFKEIHQTGVEYIGSSDRYQTVEILNLAAKSLARISENYRLCLSNTALLLILFQELSLSQPQKNKVIYYLSQKNSHDLEQYLKEESLSVGTVFQEILALPENLEQASCALGRIFSGDVYRKELEDFQETLSILAKIIPPEKIYLDFSHIPSTEYYQGLVLAGYLEGLAQAAVTGGRYDNLLHKMGISQQSALGFAVNLTVISKLFKSKEREFQQIQYKTSDDVETLIKKANKLFVDGKAFRFTT